MGDCRMSSGYQPVTSEARAKMHKVRVADHRISPPYHCRNNDAAIDGKMKALYVTVRTPGVTPTSPCGRAAV